MNNLKNTMYNLFLYIRLIRQHKNDVQIRIGSIVHDVLSKYAFNIPDRATLKQIVNEIIVDRLHIDYANESIEEARLIQQILDNLKPFIGLDKIYD